MTRLSFDHFRTSEIELEVHQEFRSGLHHSFSTVMKMLAFSLMTAIAVIRGGPSLIKL